MNIDDRNELASHPLHKRAKSLSRLYRSSEAELLETLMAMVEENLLVKMGFTGVWDYVVRELKISESQAGYYSRVAAKARAIAELKDAVVGGILSLSKARRIVGVIDETNAGFWIDAAIRLKQKPLERLVSQYSPRRAIREGFVPLPDNLTKLTVVITTEEQEKIERAQDIVSQNQKKPASLQDTLDTAVTFFLDRKDPLKKAARAAASSRTSKSRQAGTATLVSTDAATTTSVSVRRGGTRLPKNGRREKNTQVAHQVNLRDGFRCTYLYPGAERCENRRFIEHHHVIPVAKGGANTTPNIVSRCFWHHRHEHLR